MMTPVTNGVGGTNTAANPTVQNPWEIIQEIVAQGFAPKLQGRHISNHHLAEQMYLHRQSLGRTMKLPSDVLANITPYPAPVSHTTIVNDQQPLVELLAAMLAQNAPQATPETPKPTADAKPTPPPVASQAAAQARQWPKWMLPLVAALGLSSVATTAYVLWPDSPPPIEANYEVSAR